MRPPWFDLITPELEAKEGPYVVFVAWKRWMEAQPDGYDIICTVESSIQEIALFSIMAKACELTTIESDEPTMVAREE